MTLLSRDGRRFLAAYALTACVHVVSQVVHLADLRNVTHVLLVPLLMAVLVVETRAVRDFDGRLRAAVLVGAGLAASWLGDTVPMLTGAQVSDVGLKLPLFSLALLAYCLAFLPYRRGSVLWKRGWQSVVFVPVVLVTAVAAVMYPATEAHLATGVTTYAALIGIVILLSTGVATSAFAGSLLFALESCAIGVRAFLPHIDIPASGLLIMAGYSGAQLLLVVGLLVRFRYEAGRLTIRDREVSVPPGRRAGRTVEPAVD